MCDTKEDADPARSCLQIDKSSTLRLENTQTAKWKEDSGMQRKALWGDGWRNWFGRGGKKSIGNALHYYIMILNIHHVVP